MEWTKQELKFLEEHPEVFDGAEDPSSLYDKISSFDQYFWNEGDITRLVLGWAEARKFGIAFTGKVLTLPDTTKRLRISLKGDIPGKELLILTVKIYDQFTKENTLAAIRSRFESEYLFPLTDLPFIYKGIENLIMR